MKIIGFGFTKISGEKSEKYDKGSVINTNIDFEDIKEQKSEVVNQEEKALKAKFNFTVSYTDKEKKDKKNGEIALKGFIIFIGDKKETDELLNSWSTKELPPAFKLSVFNFLLKKCSIKAIQMEEELGLPSHIPLPALKPGKKKEE